MARKRTGDTHAVRDGETLVVLRSRGHILDGAVYYLSDLTEQRRACQRMGREFGWEATRSTEPWPLDPAYQCRVWKPTGRAS